MKKKKCDEASPGKQVKEIRLSDRVVKYILSRDISEMANLTVKNIAKTFEVNPSYLSRSFSRDKKIPLGEHITQMKIYRAALILITNGNAGLTIKQLARKMGFCTTSYFISVFKKFFGVGPGKYREYVKWENVVQAAE